MLRLLRVVLAMLMVALASAQGITNRIHVKALQNMLRAFGQNSALYYNWTGFDPCGTGWTGVVCDNDNAIVKLSLAAMNLKGILPPDIGTILTLESVDLSFNRELKGDIPPSIGFLTNLVELKLQQCGFTGVIPENIGLLTNLEHLQLAGNQLTGPIPTSIAPLTKLQWFDIGGNMVNGQIPHEVGDLVSLQHFHFWNNSLEGPIPATLGRLPKLVHLLLDNNRLSGTLPPALGNLQTLQVLRLSNNKELNGQIPASYGNLTSLTQLELKDLDLTGQLPDLSSMPNLETLDASLNNLDGQISPALGTSLKQLILIDLSDNYFIGNISSNLGSLEHLAFLDLSRNLLSGQIPNSIATNQPYLKLVDFSNNKLDGGGTQLRFLTSPAVALLGGNPLCNEGNVPACSATRPAEGQTAQDVCPLLCPKNSFPNPMIFKETQECVCSSPLTVVLKLFATGFPADEFDDTLATSMAQTIADTYANTSTPLNLSQIQPLAWQAVGATQVNVSFRIFPRTADTFQLDPGLTRDLVARFSGGKFAWDKPVDRGFGPTVVLNVVPPETDVGRRSHKLKTWEKAVIGIAAVLLAIGIALLVAYALVQKRRADRATQKAKVLEAEQTSITAPSSHDPNGPKLKGAKYFSMTELREATGNFNKERELGSGGYGKVYYGVLPSGQEIAIKRASADSLQGAAEFNVEIAILSQVYHKNLIRLLGFCNEAGEEILVYEYMPRGNLKDAIFRTGSGRETLPFARRVAIAAGSARGIAYLHHDVSPPIIHRDIKPTNILLDKNWEPKVADFGLSKEQTNTAAVMKTGVKGTLGYMDPEYQMTLQLTEKSDVYSFGVALLELFTAIPTIQRNETGSKHITQHVKEKLLRGGAPEIVDPALGSEYNLDALTRVIAIALQCTESNPDARPDMSAVVKELEDIRRVLWKSGVGGTPLGSAGGHSDVESGFDSASLTSVDPVVSVDSHMGTYAQSSGPTSYDPRFDVGNSNFYYSGDASVLHHGR